MTKWTKTENLNIVNLIKCFLFDYAKVHGSENHVAIQVFTKKISNAQLTPIILSNKCNKNNIM